MARDLRLNHRAAVVAAVLTGLSLYAQQPASDPPIRHTRVFFLDIRGGRVVSAAPDGSDARILVSGRSGTPDGIVVDTERGHIYWTIMGRPREDDGRIERVDLDGGNLMTVVPAGGAFTPKQLKLDAVHRKLYWADREGMRVMRADLDGSNIETLVETGRGEAARADPRNWCVGIALDVAGGKVYWTQKGGDNAGAGSIRRAGLEVPKGEDAAHRSDIEVLFDDLPEPIDLDLDLTQRMIYWTDRGDGPRGNTVSRAPMDLPRGMSPGSRTDQQILVRNLKEAIGIALDLQGARLYATDLGGTVYSARLDGSDQKIVLSGQGSLTGIAVVHGPDPQGR
jgi:DNA-binding beta-propeller fold protein YncE